MHVPNKDENECMENQREPGLQVELDVFSELLAVCSVLLVAVTPISTRGQQWRERLSSSRRRIS